MAQAASSALLKLKAAGIEVGEAAPIGIEPRVRAEAPAFEPLLEAVYDRQVVRFPYRRPGAEVRLREVEPWTIDSWRGRWYLAGFDLDRDDARVFRLDRITGPVLLTGRAPSHKVPDRLDVRAQVDAYARSSTDLGPATLKVRAGTCFYLRRGAVSVAEGADGWDTVVITARGDTAGWLAEYGADVVVVDPPALRDAVVAGLRAVAADTALTDSALTDSALTDSASTDAASMARAGSGVTQLSVQARSGPAAANEPGRLGVAS